LRSIGFNTTPLGAGSFYSELPIICKEIAPV
jgi:hypothetical protein